MQMKPISMVHRLIIAVLLCLQSPVFAQVQDKNFQDNIQGVKLFKKGDMYSYPIIRLNGGDQLELHFDDLDADVKNYYYSFQLCNADWSVSNLMPFDYIQGFQSNRLTTYRNSSLALTRYTHYQLQFPERNMAPKRSGNYLLKVFLNNDTTQLYFTRRFLVVDNRVSIAAQVLQPFDSRYSLTDQRVQVGVNTANARINTMSPQDIKVVVLQNNSWYNSVMVNKPNIYRGNYFEYNDDALSFQAGREWRWLDMRSMQLMGDRVVKMEQKDRTMQVHVRPDQERRQLVYNRYDDVDGLFGFENRDGNNPFWQGDYAWVHFTYMPPGNKAYPGQDIYLYGELTQFQVDAQSRMDFNSEKGVYEKSLFLKQGFYNYSYITQSARPGREDKVSFSFTEGNFSAAENKYMVLVYYRAFGARADELLGMAEVNSMFR